MISISLVKLIFMKISGMGNLLSIEIIRKQRQYIISKIYIDAHIAKKVLTHIDAVPDNFLFVTDDQGQEDIRAY